MISSDSINTNLVKNSLLDSFLRSYFNNTLHFAVSGISLQREYECSELEELLRESKQPGLSHDVSRCPSKSMMIIEMKFYGLSFCVSEYAIHI